MLDASRDQVRPDGLRDIAYRPSGPGGPLPPTLDRSAKLGQRHRRRSETEGVCLLGRARSPPALVGRLDGHRRGKATATNGST